MNQEPLAPIAGDGEEFEFHDAGQEWIVSFHPATAPPPLGKAHGSLGFCFTSEGQIVLVSKDSISWELPAGRPEGNETWRQTLDREVLEEASARVEDAILLGYSRGLCAKGHEKGLVIVRSLWWASISLLPHVPDYEMKYRLLVPPDEAFQRLAVDSLVPTFDGAESPAGNRAVLRRAFVEAMQVQTAAT
jgi:8-oxo-dGTP pyrophosphatase MutT (NUDIX family)